jgi:CheY-like chemotaxis protein
MRKGIVMNPLRLLVVEDDAPSLELMAEVFAGLKAEVCAIGDSQKAADMIRQQRFDGIFVDLEMPKLTGLQLAEKIRYSPWNKATPIVIVTGHEERSTMQRAFATGVTFFLQKPVDRPKLTGLYRTVRGAMIENQRRFVRLPMHTTVKCTVGTRDIKGQTWNLSRGGIQVELAGLKVGDIVQVSFSLPGSNAPIIAHGMVVWVKPDRQGIQFTQMSYKNEQDIRSFMIEADN